MRFSLYQPHFKRLPHIFYRHAQPSYRQFALNPTIAIASKPEKYMQQMSLCSKPPFDTQSTLAEPFTSSAAHRHSVQDERESQPLRPIAQMDAPRLQMTFTCAKCETRSMKSFTKNAYQRGVVIVTCPGCDARHLIADNLGWFGEHRNIEEILAEKGQRVVKITSGDVDYTPPT